MPGFHSLFVFAGGLIFCQTVKQVKEFITLSKQNDDLIVNCNLSV